MSLSHPTIIHVRRKPNRGSYPSPLSAALDTGVRFAKEVNPAALRFEGSKERIRNLFNKVELSVSSYDTAWVAMVPSPQNSEAPRFPRCVNWLLDNQLNDGSWGLPHHSPIWLKDVLSSTLACVLALKRWGIGEEHINKGLHFIELNVASVTDINKPSPIGFDIIFPSMLKYAEDLNLKLPLEPTALTAMLQKRELELTRCCESHSQVRGAYLGYISEGMGKLQDWEMVMKYQRKNGSLFNSPSTTAAALTHLKNDGCLNYLCSLLEKFGNADALTQVIKEESCYNSLGGHLKETSDVLELYRASQLTIYEDESALEEQNSLSSDFLKQNLLNRSIPSNRLARHVSQEWLNLLHSMLKEAEWARDMFVPTINEYMTNGYVSFALGPIVLPALYLVGPELSEEVVRSYELNNLFKLMSTPGRLLNDIQSFKRESREGKLNAVSLHMMHSSGSVTEEEAIGEMKGFIDSQRRELLRLVLQERDSIVPRVCKDLFWKMSKVVHLFYIKDDGFTSDDMIRTVKAIIHEPIGSF
ncbi:hypothetical protein RJ640_005080 [Escallonia rubra]|uniref:Terpene synthase metal-binding domain-containing protein n=1 Tax=Escallonia rubra TaxID=112253 RepID=A0AA88U636_9ASTE|nr:hypothetical protein RJ640_005080 [Escallonia rubra]